MRRTSRWLHLQTHHLSGNVEIDVSAGSGEAKVSMAVFRRSSNGEMLNTHCLYILGVERVDNHWRIGSIVQKVFLSDGNTSIHTGIVKP